MKSITDFYIDAFEFVSKNFYEELCWVDNRCFENQTASDFFREYVFVVLSAGMKNEVANKIYLRFMKNFEPETVGHLGKRKAIQEAMKKYEHWFMTLKQMNNKLEYLASLPFIGPITKYHLARNLGLDYAKPDRHLERLSRCFGFATPQGMCEYLSIIFGMRIGTVDLVLWRYCNQNTNYRSGLLVDGGIT